MSLLKRTGAALVLGTLVGLGGCVSLLPKSKPAQLYRFGYRTPASAPAPDTGTRTGVVLLPPSLPKPAAGDQILTYTADQAAYVAETRWVAPANTLFQDATEEAFAKSSSVRLARRVDMSSADLSLRTDVDHFETVYAAPGGAPTVRIDLRATILLRDGTFGSDHTFTDSEPAGDNRVGAIVEAYNRAVTKTLGDLATWTETQAPALAAKQASAHPDIANPAPALPAGAIRSTTSTSSSSSSTTVRAPTPR